ncbi:hypothetical protein [uncultured Desulfobacter sp.]|uniref:hypothetical protein n=1 Tax=uncultured Desulfobacter sp. TaxID=240139 RepID=UPI0029F47B69|nr:hypothetical protein [uncultured Desulfobacter sp.]
MLWLNSTVFSYPSNYFSDNFKSVDHLYKQRYYHPEEAKPFHSSIASLNAQDKKCLVRTRLRIKSGDYNWVSCSIAVYSDQMIYYIVARDITDSVLFERRLVYQAEHDTLTG